jgi:hypothetical protein
MTITITEPGQYISTSKDEPEVGLSYRLEDNTRGSGAQGRAFHALLEVYYLSGAWSYQGGGYQAGATLSEFRELVKKHLGPPMDQFVYATIDDGRPVIHGPCKWREIPEEIRGDPLRREYVRGRLKSFADYTKRERMDIITKLMAEMDTLGVHSAKYDEIRSGFKDLW